MTLVKFADAVRLNSSRTADPASAGIDRFVGLEHIEPEKLHIRIWGNVADGITFTSTFKRGQVLFGPERLGEETMLVLELGNALFGHSRGEYPLKHGKVFEDALNRLFEVCAPGTDTSGRVYGVEFENDVFAIFPYYWGDCTCGNEQNHKQDCPIVKPNFLYKPTGSAIHWYKYPLRDSYANQKVTLAGFKKIFSACIQACKERSAELVESRVDRYIKDWNWDAASHKFALQMGAFLLQFMDHLRSSGLSLETIRKHESNSWLIGSFECDYGYHDAFTPAIFLDGPGFIYEFRRKVSDSRHAIASYESTWRKIEKYVRASP